VRPRVGIVHCQTTSQSNRGGTKTSSTFSLVSGTPASEPLPSRPAGDAASSFTPNP
jgi:hypothetical protein